MNRLHTIVRFGVILAGLAGALLAWCAGAVPAALAAAELPQGGAAHGRPGCPAPSAGTSTRPCPPRLPGPVGWNKHPPLPAPAHGLVTGGMPGWQVTLIAAGAALLAAPLVMIAYRARATRRRAAVTTA
jgi:hypothetical protein